MNINFFKNNRNSIYHAFRCNNGKSLNVHNDDDGHDDGEDCDDDGDFLDGGSHDDKKAGGDDDDGDHVRSRGDDVVGMESAQIGSVRVRLL